MDVVGETLAGRVVGAGLGLRAALVVEAIRVGYRHLDCACDYGNEAEVGAGIAQAIAEGLVTREELFLEMRLLLF